MKTIEQAREAARKLRDDYVGNMNLFEEGADTIDALIAELVALKGQKPVAWVDVVDRHYGPYNFNGQELLDSGRHNLYLAAGAQPTVTCQIYGHVVGACAECNTHNEAGAQPVQAQDQRKPLTDDQIGAIWKKHYETLSGWDYGGTKVINEDDFEDVVRAVEAAHGIKGETK